MLKSVCNYQGTRVYNKGLLNWKAVIKNYCHSYQGSWLKRQMLNPANVRDRRLTFSSGDRASLFLKDRLALSVVDVASENFVMCSSPPSFHVPSLVTYTTPRWMLLWLAPTCQNAYKLVSCYQSSCNFLYTMSKVGKIKIKFIFISLIHKHWS